MDTSNQQTFPWTPTRYIRNRSDQNEVSRKSEVVIVQVSRSSEQSRAEQNRERPEWTSRSPVRMERFLSSHLL
jgi:hypothetical protein